MDPVVRVEAVSVAEAEIASHWPDTPILVHSAMPQTLFAERALRAGDEPFPAGDAPAVVADTLGLRIGQAGVAAAAIGFRHREGGLHGAIDDGLQPARLLRLRRHLLQRG